MKKMFFRQLLLLISLSFYTAICNGQNEQLLSSKAVWGKWFMQSHIVTGKMGIRQEFKQNNAPETLEFDSNGCFLLIQETHNNIYGSWSFDAQNNRILITDKKSKCNIGQKESYYKASFRIEGSNLINETIGRDTKDIICYEKSK